MVRKTYSSWIAALALSTTVIGCNDGGKKSSESPRQPATQGDVGHPTHAGEASPNPNGSVPTAATVAARRETKSVFGSTPIPNTGLNSEIAHGHVYPPARPQLAPPPANEQTSSEPAKSWGESIARTKDQAVRFAGRTYDGASAMVNHSADYVADVVGPANGEKRSRAEALKETRTQSDQYRNLSPDQLKHALEQNSTNADAIKSVLRSRSGNDVIKYLSAFLTETDANRAASNSALLIVDVFADPEYTPSKLGEIAFDLGAIAKAGYYDEVVAGRVAFLQAQIDLSARRDRTTGYLKDALFLAIPAVGAYGVLGSRANVLDRTTNVIRSVRVGRILGDGRSALSATYRRAAGAFANAGREVLGVARRGRLSNPDAVKEELKLLGFSETELTRNWDLITPKRTDVAFLGGETAAPHSVALKFRPTNRDRLDFAVSDHWDGPIPDDKQVIFFRIHRGLGANQLVVSAKFDKAYVAEVAQKLERTSDRTFLTMVDESGQATQSTIRTEKMVDADQAIEPVAPVAETAKPRAWIQGATPETPKFAPRAPLEEVEPKPPFDHLRGAIAMVTTGALTVTPTIYGYLSGERDGRDHESLYLERQVDRQARPPETVVSDLNQK